MKKLLVGLLAIVLLTGCSHKNKDTTFMLTRDDQFYALYNQKGKQLTNYNYKTFQEVKGVGYLVTDRDDKKSVISFEGEPIIEAGVYETLEAVDQMFYATKKVEVKKEDKDTKKATVDPYFKSNLYVLNGEGKVLYQADSQTAILKSELPVIFKDNEYIVLYHEGEELYRGKEAVKYVSRYKYSSSVVIGFNETNHFYHFTTKEDQKDIDVDLKQKGTYKILAQNQDGIILNDEKLKSMIYVDFNRQQVFQNTIGINDAYFDEEQNIILTSQHKMYAYPIGGVPVLLNSYYLKSVTYVNRSSDIYGPHQVYNKGKLTGELENCQLYPEAKLVYSEIFPVYVRNKGYQYYNFNSKKVIDKTYMEAEPFNSDKCAVVKINDKGYSLINDKGDVLTKSYYYQIKYIGSSYYAVYNESGTFGIIDSTGEKILPVEYIDLPEKPIVSYDDHNYLILGKNGRSYVYDIDDEMKEIFSKEGQVTLNSKGYFEVGHDYYRIDGEVIK